MMHLHRNLIGGEWVGGSEGRNINPSDTRDLVGLYASGASEDAASAITAARQASISWAKSGIVQRHDILRRISDELLARSDELGRLLSREEGKTLAEGVAEARRAAQIFDFFSGEVLRLAGEVLPSTRPGVIVEISREPVGVVGIISPWNFPIAIPAWKIAPAIAYGNAVVFKPADLVPGSAWALAEIIHRSGLPAGVFNLVMGRGSVVGQALLDSPDVNALSFTGSAAVGRQVALASAALNRRYQLEMSGKNPLVVLGDAALDNAVECAIAGAFFSTGQRCTASSRLIVEDSIHDRFVDAVVERMKNLVVGNALDPATDIGPIASEAQLEEDQRYIAIGRDEGATLAFGGERVERSEPGYYFRPALFTETDRRMRIAREEIFGPVAAVIRVRNYDEALEVANDCDFGLSAGICTTSLKYATDFKRNVEAGMVMVNLPTAGIDFHVPFGGRKRSSFGPREQGRYAIEFFTTVKTAYTQVTT